MNQLSIGAFQEQLARVLALVPVGRDPKNFIAEAIDEQIEAISSESPMGVVPAALLSSTGALASARIATELIGAPAQLAARPEGIVDLGTIEWLLRPSLPLKEGMFDPLISGIWKHLPSKAVKEQADSVCRIDIGFRESALLQLGTGFVVGKTNAGRFVVATNAHVVEAAMGLGWPNDETIRLNCDFARSDPDTVGEVVMLGREYEIHETYDLALLWFECEAVHDRVSTLPIASVSPGHIERTKIGVIGHPSFDSRVDRFAVLFGFGNGCGVKRFSPGFVRSLEDREWRQNAVRVVLHDATTLSGSSGSCMVDLETNQVIGLHFGGWPLQRKGGSLALDAVGRLFESNGAIPLWILCDDPFCGRFNFV